jgi:hypothetical protein
VVDGVDLNDEEPSLLGDTENEMTDLMAKSFDGQEGYELDSSDEWGKLVTAFVPIKNAAGKTVGILAADFGFKSSDSLSGLFSRFFKLKSLKQKLWALKTIVENNKIGRNSASKRSKKVIWEMQGLIGRGERQELIGGRENQSLVEKRENQGLIEKRVIQGLIEREEKHALIKIKEKTDISGLIDSSLWELVSKDRNNFSVISIRPITDLIPAIRSQMK